MSHSNALSLYVLSVFILISKIFFVILLLNLVTIQKKKLLNPSCFVVVFEISLRIHQNNLYRPIDLISCCSSTECCHLTSTVVSSHISFILSTCSLSISFFFSSIIAKDFTSFSKKSDLVSQHCF